MVEFVAARSGVGHLISLAWQQLQVDRMYAGLREVWPRTIERLACA